MEVEKLLYQIETKEIVLPEFQREFVWKKEDSKQLLVSMFRGYPVGSILLWETNNPPEIKNDVVSNKTVGLTKVILDGQQRLTVLYLFMMNEIPPYYSEKEITYDPRDLYFNVESGDFRYYQKQMMSNNPLWQKVIDCFQNKIDGIEIADRADGEFDKDLARVYNRNLNRLESINKIKLPIESVSPDCKIDEAIEVFDRINSQGTMLTDAELVLAHISGKWAEARRVIKRKQKLLKGAGFSFSLDFFTRCIVVALTKSAVYKSMTYEVYENTTEDDYRNAWEVVSNKIDYVVPILKQSAYVDNSNEFLTTNIYIPILAYLFENEKFEDENIKYGFLYWMFLAHIWRRYSGQTDQKLDKDVYLATQKSNPIKGLVQELEDQRGRIEVKPADLEGRDAGHPLHRMLYTLTKWNDAVDLIDGGAIRETLGDYYSIQSHHIFPKSSLYGELYDSGNHIHRKLVNEIANRAFITRKSNYEISNQYPSEYLKEIDAKSLKSHFIPVEENLWKIENYEVFLNARRKKIADKINDFLNEFWDKSNGISESFSYKEFIERGENNYVEFKETLRWDIQENRVNKELEFSAAKTLAAFMNSEGGTLFIGISDDGEVKGLDKDYQILGKKNKDGFYLKLIEIINNCLGKESHAFIHSEIVELDGNEVCVVEVNDASHPVFIKKNGDDAFYVRAAASSQPLAMSEANKYINNHWE